jgi:peptidoglycan/LPS O-acetylase OafA/YrhL
MVEILGRKADAKHEQAKTRMPELDGLRGCAILLVLIWHYFANQLSGELGWLIIVLKTSIGFTWSGVDLFFVLSGFLITGLLLDNRTSPNYFKTFYVRRVCRIFPIYYLHLTLFALLILAGIDEIALFDWLFQNNVIPLWSYATFTQNVFMGMNGNFGPHWLGITWSLAIEEQFYLILPLVVRFVPRPLLPSLFLSLCILAPILRHAVPGFVAFVLTPWRADCLLFGALLACGFRNPDFMSTVKKYWKHLNFLFVALIVGVGFMNFSGYLLKGGTFTHFWLALLFAMLLLLPLIHREGMLARALRNRILIWLGTISYGVYIFHQTVSGLVHGLIRGTYPHIGSWNDLLVTLLGLAITLVLAQLSYRGVESKIIAYGHSFSFR